MGSTSPRVALGLRGGSACPRRLVSMASRTCVLFAALLLLRFHDDHQVVVVRILGVDWWGFGRQGLRRCRFHR